MTIRLVTDSTAYLPDDLTRQHGIEVVPLHVVVGGRDRIEGRDITPDEVAAALREYTIVTTSRPTPQAFAEVYTRLAGEGATGIVSVHLSGQMSGTVEAARLAATESPVPVEVIDSETIGMAMGFAVIAGAEASAAGTPGAGDVAGGSIGAVTAAVRERIAPSSVLFYVHTLEHLRRGGRIGAAAALLGSALAIKPILTVRGGRIVPVEKVRTSARAIARIETMVAEGLRSGGVAADVAVHHLDAGDRGPRMAERLQALPDVREVRLVELGAVVGAHVGPGTVAIAVSPRPNEPAAPAGPL
ncbi:MAG: DegV family protein [Micrococcales bacterium]|nr:DegV family protein [Micrococcales bacterium]